MVKTCLGPPQALDFGLFAAQQLSIWLIGGIAKRITVLGESIGIEGLSPHDLRHYWATKLASGKTPIDKLMNAGGWSSPAMPLRYIEASKIANYGIDLLDD